MSKKKKKQRDEPEAYEDDGGEPLTCQLALTQSANILILAAEKAEHNNDVGALMKIAGGWMEIHEYLSNASIDDKKGPLGFTNAHTTEKEIQEDAIAEEPEVRIRSTTSKRVSRVH